MLVHIVADYGPGDLAFAEVAQRLLAHLPGAALVPTPVPPFATLAAGFCLAQLALNEIPAGTLLYHNVAPREDDASSRSGNAGERLAAARLGDGVWVIGVNAGHAFSFLRGAAAEIRWVDVAAEGSQFRSRDLFPAAAAAIARGETSLLGAPVSEADLPAVPDRRIAYVDGYGNIKTTIRHEEGTIADGSRLRIRIGEAEHEAVAGSGSFSVEPGQLAFAPGSSGWTASGRETRWIELFLRGGNAWDRFGRPAFGGAIGIELR